MDKARAISQQKDIAAHALSTLLAPHPWRSLGLDLDDGEDSTLGEWLIFCCLSGAARKGRGDPIATHVALREAGLTSPDALYTCDAAQLALRLVALGWKAPEPAAALLARASRALVERHAGSIDGLAREALDLEALGGALARLAPGFGRASVARFLRPLRDRFDVVDELPMAPAAIAAAAHLGYCDESTEPEFAASLLRRRLVEDAASAGLAHPPPFRDFESALEQLGQSACLRKRASRCPLGEACPKREDARLEGAAEDASP